MQDGMDRQAETRHTVVVLTNFVTSFEIHVNKKTCQTTTALYIIQGRRNDFESGGARPLSSKESGGAQVGSRPNRSIPFCRACLDYHIFELK